MWDEDEDGNKTQRYEYEHHQDCKTHAFQYKFNVFNTPMIINYDKVSGGFWKSSKLNFTACNAFAPDVPLFAFAVGEGSNSGEGAAFALHPLLTRSGPPLLGAGRAARLRRRAASRLGQRRGAPCVALRRPVHAALP